MKSVIGPIALIGACVATATPGCIESSCEEKRTCGGSPAPTESDAGSAGALTPVPLSTGGRAGGSGFLLGGGPSATGGVSSQGGSAGSEPEPAAKGGEAAAGGAGAGGEPSVSDAGAGGTEATPCQPDSETQDTCSQAGSGSGGESGTDVGAGGAAGQADSGEAGSAGAPTAEGCDPESRVRKELLVNGRFEPTSSAWNIVNTTLQTGEDAHSAPNFLRLAAFGSTPESAVQLVTFPPEAADITLSFYVRVVSANSQSNDVLHYGFSLNEQSAEFEVYALEDEPLPEWTLVEASFPATYAGQTKHLYFGGWSDEEPGFNLFFVDTVSLTALVCP